MASHMEVLVSWHSWASSEYFKLSKIACVFPKFWRYVHWFFGQYTQVFWQQLWWNQNAGPNWHSSATSCYIIEHNPQTDKPISICLICTSSVSLFLTSCLFFFSVCHISNIYSWMFFFNPTNELMGEIKPVKKLYYDFQSLNSFCHLVFSVCHFFSCSLLIPLTWSSVLCLIFPILELCPSESLLPDNPSLTWCFSSFSS